MSRVGMAEPSMLISMLGHAGPMKSSDPFARYPISLNPSDAQMRQLKPQSFIGFFLPPVATSEAPQPEVVLGHPNLTHLVFGQATVVMAEPDLAAILIQLEVDGDSVLVSRVRAGEVRVPVRLDPRPPLRRGRKNATPVALKCPAIPELAEESDAAR